MIRFGGNNFSNCSVPLVFAGRYFLLESAGDKPLVSVVIEHEGQPYFEVLKNEVVESPLSTVTKTAPGIVTVADRQTGRFLYKVRPGSETSVVFGTLKGDQITATINDKEIRVGGMTMKNCTFNGVAAGVVVEENGSVGIGCQLPEKIRNWFHPTPA